MFLFMIAIALFLHPAVSILAVFSGLGLVGMAVAGTTKQTWQQVVKNDSGATVVGDVPVTILGNGKVGFSVSIGHGETAEIDLDVDVSQIQSAFISSSKAADVFTNAADGSGGQHMVLVGGVSQCWNKNMAAACPFTPDITKFFITNNDGAADALVSAEFVIQKP